MNKTGLLGPGAAGAQGRRWTETALALWRKARSTYHAHSVPPRPRGSGQGPLPGSL